MNRILKCDKYRITQGFGGKNNHKGIDVVKYYSEMCPIKAHTEGTVVWIQTGQKWNGSAKSGTNATYGNAVKIKHSNGYFTLYAHMEKVYVKKGQKVKTGQEIGYMGNTGKTSSKTHGGHLHWEIRKPNETRINPKPYINANLPGMEVKHYYQAYDNIKNKWLPKVAIGSSDYAGNDGNAISSFRTEDADEYCAYDIVKKKWLPPVKGFKDYAGNIQNNLGGIAIKSSKLKYRVRLKNSKRWLGWITGYDLKDFENGFAGNLNEPIDRIQIAYK
jgi:hypothetical protein